MAGQSTSLQWRSTKWLCGRSVPTSTTSGRSFPTLALLEGRYHFNVVTTDQDFMQSYDAVEAVEPFVVVNPGPERGVVRLEHRWESSSQGRDSFPE